MKTPNVSIQVEGDMVNHPSHYKTKSGLETIDVIAAFTEELAGMEAVCTANVLKYVCRWKKKNGLQDLRKAQWYLNHLIEIIEQNNRTEETKRRLIDENNNNE